MTERQTKSEYLRLTVLGAERVTLGEHQLVRIGSGKVKALLIYLAVESNRSHPRSKLAELFWPERESGLGRKSLKQAISNLRAELGDRDASNPFLHVSRNKVRFNPASAYNLDVEDFVAAVESVKTHNHADIKACSSCFTQLQRAVDLYRGDFLKDFILAECNEFEEWLIVRREAFRRQAAWCLRRLSDLYLASGQLLEAQDTARRLVTIEVWNERNHRRLIELLVLAGKRSEALKQYQKCEMILMEEFGVEPSRVTRELNEQIRSGLLQTPEFDHKSRFVAPSPASTEKAGRWFGNRSFSKLLRRTLIATISVTGLAAAAFGIRGLMTLRFGASGTQSSVRVGSNEYAEHYTSTAGQIAGFPGEREILIRFYEQTDGDRWVNTEGWLTESDHCSWYGITCRDSAVTMIALPDNQLYGELPPELGELHYLDALYLNGNLLTGDIPPQLGELENLEGLNLSYNDLEGSIPPELGKLSKLRWMGLNGNPNLSGEIPPELGKLEMLEDLVLSSSDGGTQLTGAIPPELGKLSRLINLVIADALISGWIPPELGNLTRLRYLDLSNNPLEGEIPSELGNCMNLEVVHLGEGPNKLTGSLPMSFTRLSKLRLLQYHQTMVCEPVIPEFQAWLHSIPEVYGTGLHCQQ